MGSNVNKKVDVEYFKRAARSGHITVAFLIMVSCKISNGIMLFENVSFLIVQLI